MITDGLSAFVEKSALRWEWDRRYREQLTREGKPTVEELFRRQRELAHVG